MVVQQGAQFYGIVVSRTNYKERDMLVKILTDKYGFKTFLIRGARKPGFKLSAAILPFTHGIYLGRISDTGLSFLTTTKKIKQYQKLTTDIEANAYATYILGLAERALSGEELIQNGWFLKIKKLLDLIEKGLDPAIITNIFELQLLDILGVKQNFKSCVVCQTTSGSFDYSESYGGLLCQKHWYLDEHRFRADQKTIYYLRLLSCIDLDDINSINVKQTTRDNLRKTIDRIYEDQVGIFVPAKKFIDQMAGWNQLFTKET